MNKLFKRLACILPFILIVNVYASDHDACGIYVDIINNSRYIFDATGIGSGGNYNWQDAGGFNNHSQILPHGKAHIFTTPDFSSNWKEHSYQFFDLIQAGTSNKTTFELYILDGAQGMRLTNKTTESYIDTNASMTEMHLVFDQNGKECTDMKPHFTVIIGADGHVNDQETLASYY